MQKLSYTEYAAWQAYYNIEPFGSIREDYRSGTICATLVNVARGLAGDKESKPVEAHDFIPTYDSIKEAEEVAEVEEMNKRLKSAFSALKAFAV